MVHLGHAAWKMAKQVFHASTPMWTTKECNAFMAKYLQLVPRQKKEYEADLQKEDFLKEYEKQPGFQAAFEYMRKMQASARSHRTGMIPLFHLADALMKTTEETRDTLDRCGAVVIPDNEPEALACHQERPQPHTCPRCLSSPLWSSSRRLLDERGESCRSCGF